MNQGTLVALWQMSMIEYMCKITINQRARGQAPVTQLV